MADQLVKLLNGYGYQPIFARVGLQPPNLYTYERTARGIALQLRGDLAGYLPQGAAVPAVQRQQLFDAIEASSSSEKNASASLSFLQRILACIGITSAPKIDLSFAGSSEFKFALRDLEAVALEPAVLEPLLAKLELDRLPPDLLAKGKTYIAYEYLTASTVTLERGDAKAFDAKVDGRIGEFVETTTQASVHVQENRKMVFQAKDGKRAAFATKVGRVSVENGTRYLRLDDGFAAAAGTAAAPVIPQLNAVLVVLDDAAP